tara:strand:- start:150 stop:512 length:363 start_codon:yes stop_codon:yes gene_type:complete
MLPILNAVAGLAGTWLEGRQEKSKMKQKLEVAKVAAQVKKVEQDGNWDEKAVANMDSSWKDEAWTIFFILIIGASFVKPLQPIMKDGFAFLNTAPDFIKYGILASIAASFGLKSIAKIRK